MNLPTECTYQCFVIKKMVLRNSYTRVILLYTGGILTLTWYTYMCLPFGALFREIWYSDRGGGVSSEMKEPKLHIGVYLGQIIIKSTQFSQNWVLFFPKWYTDGWKIRQKVGIEKV